MPPAETSSRPAEVRNPDVSSAAASPHTAAPLAGAAFSQQRPKLNVLMIAVDDLRPEFGAYGSPIVKSPNLDRLAAEGLRFTDGHSSSGCCSPSRSSLIPWM